MSSDLQALENEFAQATTVLDQNRPKEKGKLTERNPLFTTIRYADAYTKVRENAAWKKHHAALLRDHPHQPSGCFSFFQTNISKALHEDRDFVMCITTTSSGRDHLAFSWEDETHSRVISTVYKKLTDKPPHSMVEANGPHWLTLGFQGENFLNDAGRLGGIFVTLQMLYFIDTAPRLAMKVYMESRPPTMRQFSWALWSIFCSTRVLITFSRKKLNAIINKRKSVMDTLNLFYLGIFAELFDRWCEKEKREEMHDFNAFKKDLTTWSLSKPEDVIKRAELAMKQSHDMKEAVKPTGPPLDLTNLKEAEEKKEESDDDGI